MDAPGATEAVTPPRKTVLVISGMTCAACASRVERALSKVPDVVAAHVDLVGHRAAIEHRGVPTATLVSAVARTGYGATPADSSFASGTDVSGDHARRLWVATVFALPVIVIAMSHGMIHVPHQAWWEMGLSLPVMTYAGWPIWRGAWRAVRHGGANMDSLVTLGAWASFGLGYFEAAVAPVAFVSLSRWIEARLRARAQAQLDGLAAHVDQDVTVLDAASGAPRATPRALVASGDVLLVRPGAAIPVDGDIVEGSSYIDESMLTGESQPQRRGVREQVFAGTVNGAGALVVRARTGASESVLAQIVAAAADARLTKAPIAAAADAISARMVPVILAIASLTVAAWWGAGMWAGKTAMMAFPPALAFGATVVMIACPCALGLATPAALAVALGHLASRGVVVRSAAVFEKAARVGEVIFDKTGTLTRGRPDVIGIQPAPGESEARVLSLAAAVEAHSEHPLAGAILRAAGQRGTSVPVARNVEATMGQGVAGEVEGARVMVGKRAWLIAEGCRGATVDEAFPYATTAQVAVAGAWIGSIAIADERRADAAEALAALRGAGLHASLLTGDRRAVAVRFAEGLGLAEADVWAEVSPQQKAEHVAARKQRGGVAMIGDGMNDAVALAAADLSIAMSHGSDISIQAADVVLTRSHLTDVPMVLGLARRTVRIIRENLAWAFAYNVLALPLAAGVFYPLWGLKVSPMVASALMAMSSITVLLNSQRLRR